MSLKSLSRKATAKMGRQILTVKTHSPALLLGMGAIGATASVILACRATLKLSEVLEEGQDELQKIDPEKEGELKKKTFGVQLQTAIKIARLYAPSAILLASSIAAMTGSHVILKKRNAGLAAAYTVVSQGFRDYRKRVVDDLGEEKDYEYFHGVEEREVVEETESGPVVTTVKGIDQEAIKNADPEKIYKRVYDSENKHWSDIPNQNQFVLQMIQSELNDLLQLQGYVFLNQAYDLLGFKPTQAGQIVGWKKNPEPGKGDGFVSFGVWKNGVYRGTQWLNGESDSILLDFNVDGPILGALEEV